MGAGMRALFLTLAITLSAPVLAADENGGIYVTGSGNNTCGQWLDAVEKKHLMVEAAFAQWVLGFVTGRNAYSPGNARGASFEDAKHFGRKHCREKPLDPIFAVGVALVEATGKAPLPEWKGPPIGAKTEER